MTSKLPEDFNPGWYLATYADVALSGLSPSEHYRRFGRRMGRAPNGKSVTRSAQLREAAVQPRVTDAPSPQPEVIAPQEPLLAEPFPIIDRPPAFEPEDVLPMDAPLRPGMIPGEPIKFEALARVAASGNEPRSEVLAALAAYARLFELDVREVTNRNDPRMSCGAAPFQAAETRIEHAWYPGHSTLRLRLAGGDDRHLSGRGVLRAYQATPRDPGHLTMLGPGLQLPSTGPVFHDLDLVHPMMPVLLELSDLDGSITAMGLMPFPSLLLGGLHWAELKGLQCESDPMDDFWSRGEILLRELIGQPHWGARRVLRVIAKGRSSDASPMLTTQVQEWLAAVFGMEREQPGGDGVDFTASHSSGEAPAENVELALPANSIPTISVLVSRCEPHPQGDPSNSWLVAEANGGRPRWSVTLPLSAQPPAHTPGLFASGADGKKAPRPASTPIAIVFRSPSTITFAAEPVFDVSAPLTLAAETTGPLTVLLDVSDASSASSLVKMIGTWADDVEYIVRRAASAPMDEELEEIFSSAEWSILAGDCDFRDIANRARNETILSLSDRVNLREHDVLGTLCSIVGSDPAIGSASCALLGETMIKRKIVLQPASGGIFPARISLATGPRLSFFEPDVLDCLPNLTYPVVANTSLLTVFRRSAVASLPRPCGPVPDTVADIRLGLDLIRAGFQNWCTTSVTAGLRGPYVRRDSIDPVGGDYLQYRRWEEILGNVTLVRELI